jgi:NAD(P)-dependent dehydrogenase (short-subunit alcohol dehydrogenase family)
MAQLEAMGADCIGAAIDVRSHDSLESFFARTADRWGALDVLVNVAGGTFKGAFAD